MVKPNKSQFVLTWYINSAVKDVLKLTSLNKNCRYIDAVTSERWYNCDELDKIIVSDRGEIRIPTNKTFHATVLDEKKNLDQQKCMLKSVKESHNCASNSAENQWQSTCISQTGTLIAQAMDTMDHHYPYQQFPLMAFQDESTSAVSSSDEDDFVIAHEQVKAMAATLPGKVLKQASSIRKTGSGGIHRNRRLRSQTGIANLGQIGREVLIDVYGSTLGNYSVTGKRGGKPLINQELLKGFHGRISRTQQNNPIPKTDFIKYICKTISNKRKYEKQKLIKKINGSTVFERRI
ncbi:hypothetical protein PV327_008806 [Microctonus hyperodae]|uniref:BEN domain-containing protein n=1 Tax=Microctonus hyperodae TaxID=165561 RepID=A0AA39FT39_MICHY|nr:hypothetical protein PV327_008806 [Microctonus hyperodae]